MADLASLAKIVVTNRLEGKRLPGLMIGDETLSDKTGYAVQVAANLELEAHLGKRSGYKIGATTPAMLQLLAVSQPVAGEVFANTVQTGPGTVPFTSLVRGGVETEIAVRLSSSFPTSPRSWSRHSIIPYVDTVLPAIEIVDDRYEAFASAGGGTFAADNAFNAGSILGPERSDWHELDLSDLEAKTRINGELVASASSHLVLGHPLDALVWLANRYAELGRSLDPGSFVSLGTITPVQWLSGPCQVDIEIAGLGGCAVEIV